MIHPAQEQIMAIGKLKQVINTERKFGSQPWYWFVKVQAAGRGEGGEEYWLVTEGEGIEFAERAEANPEDQPGKRRGVFDRVANTERKFGSQLEYVVVEVQSADHPHTTWMLTETDLERLRKRVDVNTEDIEANKEGWLADLLD